MDTEQMVSDRKVTLRGKEYSVQCIDGFGMQIAQDAKTKEETIAAMYKIAARCLGLPFDEVWGTETTIGFSEEEVMSVVAEAQRTVKAVEATAKNDGKAEAARDEVKPSLPPDSHQSIQLAS